MKSSLKLLGRGFRFRGNNKKFSKDSGRTTTLKISLRYDITLRHSHSTSPLCDDGLIGSGIFKAMILTDSFALPMLNFLEKILGQSRVHKIG